MARQLTRCCCPHSNANRYRFNEEAIRERLKEKGEALYSNVLMRRIIELYGRGAIVEFFKLVITTMTNVPIVIDPYRMPLRNGAHLECSVINPLISAKSTEVMRSMIDKYSAYISGDKLDIWLKRQNTMEFLREALRQYEEFENKMRSRGIEVSDLFRSFFSA